MATRRILLPAPGDEWGPLPPHASERPRRRGWRWAERILLVIALISLGYYSYVSIEARLYQAYENRELDAILASAPPPTTRSGSNTVAPGFSRKEPATGSAIGRIEIPRLGVSTIIRAGSDARTLSLAVGHIPGTALPGENGNIGLAGHRDTFFRRLRDIREHDEIRIVTADGTFTFRVERTNIVQPRDTWVLNATDKPTLTLVTCYPFTYIGSAPKRFIVRATIPSI
jgi:sortase A